MTPEIVLDRSVFIDAGNLAPALTLSGSPTNRIFNIPMDQAIGAQTFNMTAPSGATATQSSEYNGGQFPASLALDGNTGNFTHTAAGDSFPTWTVNLNRDVQIDSVVLRNRGGGCCPERLSDITVRFLSANDTVLGESDVLNPLNVLGGPPSLTFHSFWPVAAP